MAATTSATNSAPSSSHHHHHGGHHGTHHGSHHGTHHGSHHGSQHHGQHHQHQQFSSGFPTSSSASGAAPSSAAAGATSSSSSSSARRSAGRAASSASSASSASAQQQHSNSASRWYFSEAALRSTPSIRGGLSPEKELSYRQQAANFIQDMGQRMHVTQLCINTAIVYMQRFYIFHEFSRFHRNSIATAALYLAAKVEEQPRDEKKLEQVIKTAHFCLHRDSEMDIQTKAYMDQAQELVTNENILLQTLGFDVVIEHPHTFVVRGTQLVKAPKDLAQTSYFMATNSLHLTTMCLRYPPTIVACVCIHLACEWSNYKIPLSAQGKEWFHYVDSTGKANIKLLDKLKEEFLSIFEKCPSRLKNKIKASTRATREEEERRRSGSSYKSDFSQPKGDSRTQHSAQGNPHARGQSASRHTKVPPSSSLSQQHRHSLSSTRPDKPRHPISSSSSRADLKRPADHVSHEDRKRRKEHHQGSLSNVPSSSLLPPHSKHSASAQQHQQQQPRGEGSSSASSASSSHHHHHHHHNHHHHHHHHKQPSVDQQQSHPPRSDVAPLSASTAQPHHPHHRHHQRPPPKAVPASASVTLPAPISSNIPAVPSLTPSPAISVAAPVTPVSAPVLAAPPAPPVMQPTPPSTMSSIFDIDQSPSAFSAFLDPIASPGPLGDIRDVGEAAANVNLSPEPGEILDNSGAGSLEFGGLFSSKSQSSSTSVVKKKEKKEKKDKKDKRDKDRKKDREGSTGGGSGSERRHKHKHKDKDREKSSSSSRTQSPIKLKLKNSKISPAVSPKLPPQQHQQLQQPTPESVQAKPVEGGGGLRLKIKLGDRSSSESKSSSISSSAPTAANKMARVMGTPLEMENTYVSHHAIGKHNHGSSLKRK